MSFRIKLLLFSTLSVLIGMSMVTLIALFGISDLNQVAARNVEKGLLGVNQLVFESLLSGTTSLDTSLSVNQFSELLTSLKIGEKGFMFVATRDGRVIGINSDAAKVFGIKTGNFIAPSPLKDSTNPDVAHMVLPASFDDANNLTTNIVNLSDGSYEVYLRLTNFQTKAQNGNTNFPVIVGFVSSRDEALSSIKGLKADINNSAQGILVNQLSATLAVLIIVLVVNFVLYKPMTTTLRALISSTANLRQRKYFVEIPVRSKDEFGQLSEAFNEMAAEISSNTHRLEEQVTERTLELKGANAQITALNTQLQSENSRLKTEVEVTRRLQQMLLPKEHELAGVVGLDITGYMNPAEEVGGDYYDVLQQNGRVKIGIGDVTGHGLESGVLMLMVQTAVRTLLTSQETNPVRFMDILNRTIYDNVQRMDSDKNLSLLMLDYNQGNLRLSGQHEEAIVVRHTGEVQLVDTMLLGFPIGLEEEIKEYVAEVDIKLEKDDVVVLYTDGITEAFNPAQQQYGLERLCKVVKGCYQNSSYEIKQAVIKDLHSFIGNEKVYDDITLVVLKQK